MSENVPSVTVVIAARPGQADIQAVAGSLVLEYPRDKLDIIVARGKQPSAQRNAAMRVARGEVLYFLDDDSVPQPANLRRAAAYFRDPQVKMVGGPNLCPPEAPPLEQVFALVMASWLGFFSSRARYDAVGQARAASEKELILCNLTARKDAMLELGGFNEALYPNEENALMDEFQKRGGKLVYDPEFTVRRRPRSNMNSFTRMLMTYGRGRAEQFRLHPTLGSAPNFVPPLFLVYLVLVLAYLALLPLLLGRLPHGEFLVLPLVLYALILLAQGLVLARRAPVLFAVGALPLIFLTHVLYGWGFWRGLFTELKPPGQREPVKVVLETVPVPPAQGKFA